MNTRNNKFNLTTFFLFMNSIVYKQLYVFTGLFLIIIMSPKALCISHPHMIVKESEYTELQARAAQWPWSVKGNKSNEFLEFLNTHRVEENVFPMCDVKVLPKVHLQPPVKWAAQRLASGAPRLSHRA